MKDVDWGKMACERDEGECECDECEAVQCIHNWRDTVCSTCNARRHPIDCDTCGKKTYIVETLEAEWWTKQNDRTICPHCSNSEPCPTCAQPLRKVLPFLKEDWVTWCTKCVPDHRDHKQHYFFNTPKRIEEILHRLEVDGEHVALANSDDAWIVLSPDGSLTLVHCGNWVPGWRKEYPYGKIDLTPPRSLEAITCMLWSIAAGARRYLWHKGYRNLVIDDFVGAYNKKDGWEWELTTVPTQGRWRWTQVADEPEDATTAGGLDF